jgi:hypothetical protein
VGSCLCVVSRISFPFFKEGTGGSKKKRQRRSKEAFFLGRSIIRNRNLIRPFPRQPDRKT